MIEKRYRSNSSGEKRKPRVRLSSCKPEVLSRENLLWWRISKNFIVDAHQRGESAGRPGRGSMIRRGARVWNRHAHAGAANRRGWPIEVPPISFVLCVIYLGFFFFSSSPRGPEARRSTDLTHCHNFDNRCNALASSMFVPSPLSLPRLTSHLQIGQCRCQPGNFFFFFFSRELNTHRATLTLAAISEER